MLSSDRFAPWRVGSYVAWHQAVAYQQPAANPPVDMACRQPGSMCHLGPKPPASLPRCLPTHNSMGVAVMQQAAKGAGQLQSPA
jgi:hypothetical protein